MGFTIFEISSGKPLINGDGLLHFDFCADRAISYILATGAGAAFDATIDLKGQTDGGVLDKKSFINIAREKKKEEVHLPPKAS
ncbi:hypothetical protein RJ641_003853 [Dillenia turbinata]|uniref:Uncharacterized protein n=1 Tax=Dillenia turbinata TaxID=194707 RepID=A0AAN8Z7R0_9MAGN